MGLKILWTVSHAQNDREQGIKGGCKMADKIFEVEHKPGEEVVIRIRPAKFPAVPPQARSNFCAAQKEGLLTLRSLIDAAIEQMDKAESSKEKKRERVSVE